MSPTKSLLVELLVEELPPKALKRIGEAFGMRLHDELKRQGLISEHTAITSYATPRRLAVHLSGVRAVAADREVVQKVMPMAIAFDAAGKPTAALHKAMAKLGRSSLVGLWPNAVDGPDRLHEDADGKGRAVFLRSLARGVLLAVGLQNALDETLANLPIPKMMSYQLDDGWKTVHFVRPAHGLVALHGADVVSCTALGLESGRETRGHRFEAAVEPIVVQNADHYARQLDEQGAVVASFAHRRADVQRQLQHAAGALGLKPIDDDALLDEVTALVERPNVLLCQFEPQFLAVPPECLILTMKANQKYFPLLDAGGKLTNRFLVVSNIRPDDANAVVQGNERVVRPRLADAKFFFDQDRKKTLESRVPGLDKVVYHARLGTMGERVRRVRAIAREIGSVVGGPSLAEDAARAAHLAKTDLLTDMVGEFPELQGVMGGYYARHDGEMEQVAFAIEDHYKPRFAGDALPRERVGLVLALADKLETLVGLFGIGQTPTGDKDPFALRRHALGVLRMLIERALPVDLPALVAMAQGPFAAVPGWSEVNESLLQFFHERLAVLLREQGSTAQEVDAVLGPRPARIGEVPQRLAAVRSFAGMPESASLAAANKRITNILKKSVDASGGTPVEPALFAEDAERALHGALNHVAPRADALFEQRDYTASLRELAALKAPVDAFFDHVMVNADDAKLRANRLALLSALHRAMNRVADLSRLAT
ncbi:MAG TPA: glycine--tRNA ligase subunit beta [Burkholderiaceae bacterium]|nr:glycine--tRNA ligase subunit beta [Burkholderiaceae bacterium]